MGIFNKISFPFNSKKTIACLNTPSDPVLYTDTSIKCSATPYKTIALFDLNVEKPKYDGAIPDTTIKFYPL